MIRTTLALLLLAGATHAQLPGEQSAQGDVSVTIYNNDQALVQDTRQLTLPGGRSRQEFPDVSASIRPETVTLSGRDIGIVEQNFDYDLLSPAALMQKAVGQTITIVRINPATGAETREQARVLAANGGVVLQIGSRIEVLRDDGLPVRVIFDRVPPNLRARPTLSVTLNAGAGGTRPVTLSYLSSGLGWKADYVALFDEGRGLIDVQGWITLTNNSGTPYRNARTLLVAGAPAGSPNAGYNHGRFVPPPPPPGGRLVRAGTESADRERIGDFYLYPIAERTTIAAAQQKQVSFLDVTGAAAQRSYEFRNGWLGQQGDPASAATVLKFSNARAGGLGDALPAGTVRVYLRDARGQPQFIGENAIDHTPMGSDLSLRTGDAFDVKVKTELVSREKITLDEWEKTARYRITENDRTRTVTVERTPTFWRTTMRYTLTNARPGAVTVDLIQGGLGGGYRDTRIVSETIKGEQKSFDERLWHVPVAANGEAVLTATVDTRY